MAATLVRGVVDSALAYAARGWPVIPVHGLRDGRCTCGNPKCKHPGKHPRIRTGPDHQKASLSESEIRCWWQRWPNSNVGIVTGARSGLIVIDIDPRHGGTESLRKLSELSAFPITPRVRTGSGGLHLYYRHPGRDVPNRVGVLPGVDVRGDGGFVVAPPSAHVDGVYEWT